MSCQTLLALILALLAAVPSAADDKVKDEPNRPAPAAKAGPAVLEHKSVHNILAQFDKGDPGWKVRMAGLVSLAKIGPAAVPVLIEALKHDSAHTREFAAQALVLLADTSTRPALEQALVDPKTEVRLYAIQALSMLGPLPRTRQTEAILNSDPTLFGVRPMMAAALERTDRPDLAQLRKTLAAYDLADMDSARLGEIVPDFTLTNFTGKTYRLSEFRGKQAVVLRFILHDF